MQSTISQAPKTPAVTDSGERGSRTDSDKTVEQLRHQFGATGIKGASSGQSVVVSQPTDTPISGLQPEQANSHKDQKQDGHDSDKDQLQGQAQLLSEQLEAANKKLAQAENTANDLRAAMRAKLTVSDQRQIQIEERVAELQQQLELHSIPAEVERTALIDMCESLQAENKELKQQVCSLKQQISKVQTGVESTHAV